MRPKLFEQQPAGHQVERDVLAVAEAGQLVSAPQRCSSSCLRPGTAWRAAASFAEPSGRGRWRSLRHAGSGDEHGDRDELACRGGAYEGVKDLVIAEH